MVGAKEKQQVRLLRTQVIHIYDDEDGDICDSCQKVWLEVRYDRRKRRSFFAGLLVLLLFITSAGVFQSSSTNVDHGQSESMIVVDDEPVQHQYNSTTSSIVRVPKPFDRTIADISEPFEKGRDMPYFFHIPRAAGSTVKDILGKCVYTRIAWNATATREGLKHAKDTKLVQSGQVDVITTQYLHEGATLFDGQQHRGRCFALMRHPIERAVSLFSYLGSGAAKHEPYYDPQLQYITVEMYAKSKRIEHNWVTRFLSNELDADLTPRHLQIAKAVLKQKCLVGLLEEKVESWLRFEKFFGWQLYTHEMRECQDELLNWNWSSKHQHDLVEEGSPAWELLYQQNMLDMELYSYAKQLFLEQRSLFV